MNKDKISSTLKSKYKKRKIILLGGLAIILTIGSFGVYSAFSSNREKEQALAEGKENEESKKENSEEANTDFNNSGYLSLDIDPNADDALKVSERTSGIITGKKLYPVRDDGKKVVYLTFDDGPSTTNTKRVLDVLDKYNVKGTFFILGKRLEDNKEAENILKRIAYDGHAIANHSYGHDYKYLYPNRVINTDRVIKDYNKTNSLLKNILGKDFSTRVLRFPGGYWSWEGREKIKPILNDNGIANLDWNALNGDAEGGGNKSAKELVAKTKKSTESLGKNADSIVLLMHDTYGKETTVEALPEIIEYYKSKGFEFRTIK